jgi:folate-dependent phosphoribosylglycinamide formyltransferase PurN
MNGEMTICDVNVKGGRLHYITKEDIDNGDVIEELPIFEIQNEEDYNLK